MQYPESILQAEKAAYSKLDAPEFIAGWRGWGCRNKNKKLISRTKFESAQKGCPGIYSDGCVVEAS
ncbi:hypothetical protein C5S36_10300 [Candidatus Methanophagaceae archaeon]|jgi:hypothetical protein|nr:hypothetical protein C5S36_10300 [Methanophagales archaeon]